MIHNIASDSERVVMSVKRTAKSRLLLLAALFCAVLVVAQGPAQSASAAGVPMQVWPKVDCYTTGVTVQRPVMANQANYQATQNATWQTQIQYWDGHTWRVYYTSPRQLIGVVVGQNFTSVSINAPAGYYWRAYNWITETPNLTTSGYATAGYHKYNASTCATY